MDRNQILLKGIEKNHLGVEIAPWMNPLVPKREGYRSLSLDVFTTTELRQTAANDPNIPNEDISKIEDVDIIGSADRIGNLIEPTGLLGRLDYILSSHNFEHLPNPILFLQGCERALCCNGILIMALPDYRTCFDYFRPFTTTAEFIGAFFDQNNAPSPQQSFMQNSRHCRLMQDDGSMIGSFALDEDANRIEPLPGIREAFLTWRQSLSSNGNPSYKDTHCWAFSPSSFALIILDLIHLGLTSFCLEEVTPTNGNEFYVRLRKLNAIGGDDPLYYSRRAELMHASKDEAAENTRLVQGLRQQLRDLQEQLSV